MAKRAAGPRLVRAAGQRTFAPPWPRQRKTAAGVGRAVRPPATQGVPLTFRPRSLRPSGGGAAGRLSMVAPPEDAAEDAAATA